MMQVWIATKTDATFYVEPKKKPISKQEQIFNMKIGNLINYGLYQFDYMQEPEIDCFRRSMARVRMGVVRKRNVFHYMMAPNVESSAVSATYE